MSAAIDGLHLLKSAKRIVVKLGSALLRDRESNEVRGGWLHSLASDIAALADEEKQFVLVSSGAVALGAPHIGYQTRPKRQDHAQAAAAVGQVELLSAYRDALKPHDLRPAQLLLSLDDFEDRARYLVARRAAEALLNEGIVPVVNENDPIADLTMGFGDNDRLAARVAQLVGADLLILLSDIDGLYDSDPRDNQEARHIPYVDAITADIRAMAGQPRGGPLGSGGMATKVKAAQIATAAGCAMVISEGSPHHPIQRLQSGARATWFKPTAKKLSVRKGWLQSLMQTKGSVSVDKGAAKALAGGRSLLPAGVLAVEGRFAAGDPVQVMTHDGYIIGQGLSAYGATEIRIIRGAHSDEISDLLGTDSGTVVIHADDFVLTGAGN